ncbi:MAG: hypothetical protein A2Z02_07330 [Chloroflexi bacterium RBG_16_48_7]|nr:MAG: hypothetical protein A2Z02_07330 [Chloroflexi bacterium RBG_16_48_7]
MTDLDYIEARNALIPEAIAYADRVSFPNGDIAWNAAYHMKMNELVKERGFNKMGNNVDGNEKRAISIMNALPAQVRGCISHHLRNPLTSIHAYIQTGDAEIGAHAAEEMKHLLKDLEMFGL